MHEIVTDIGFKFEDVKRLIQFVQQHKEFGLIHLVRKNDDICEFDLGFEEIKKEEKVFLHTGILRYGLSQIKENVEETIK